MANLIALVEEARKRVRAGFPEGSDNISAQQLPILLRRIDELEAALMPFARIGSRIDSTTPELVDCYRNHCAKAYEVLDPAQSIRRTAEQVLYPLEG
jgi:hypothetical protein